MTSEPLNMNIDPLESRFGIIGKDLATCADHGDYVSITSKHREGPSGCPECAKIRQAEQDKAEQEAKALKAASDRLERKLGNALIPKRFQGKSFDDYRAIGEKQKKYLATCIDYAENFRENAKAGRCLLLLGKTGTGKTHLAAAIADRVIRTHGVIAVYVTVSTILQHIKGSYGNGEYTEREAFEHLTEPDLLIIDEVGATKQTEFEQATLFQVINGRYEDQRPTIVVSNLSPEGLKEAVGERCIDRLREGGGKALVFDWGSMRTEIGK